MTCFKPLKAWQNGVAHLDTPSNIYYKSKKISFKKLPHRIPIEIPCGHCLGCRLDHANMWATRITCESKNWKKNCFITLTYNTPNLPLTENGYMTLVKKDLQDFLKRLRYFENGFEEWENPKNGKVEKPIRYFACGEYGPKGGRPHYHLAVFNWEPKDLKLYKNNKHGQPIFKSKQLQKIWGKGFVTVEELNFHTASYIARYVQKKAGIEAKKREYTGEKEEELRIDERNRHFYIHTINKQKTQTYETEQEFVTMSRAVGIGRLYWEQNKEKIKRNKGIFLKVEDKVKLKPIPRYFKKLWQEENWEEFYQYKYEIQQDLIIKKVQIINRISLPNGYSDEQKWEFYLESQYKTLIDKAKYLKRNEFI